MSNNHFKIGDKVVPHSKTVAGYCNLDGCERWKHAKTMNQNFLYVVQIDNNRLYTLNERSNTFGGNYYNRTDLTLYDEKQNKTKKDDKDMTTSVINPDYKLQIGQKVRIKQNLDTNKEYKMTNNPKILENVCQEMTEIAGEIFTIEYHSMRKYRLDGAASSYYWTDEMLDPVLGNEKIEVVEINESYGITIHIHKVIYSHSATIIFYKHTNEPKEKLKKSVAKCIFSDTYSKETGYKVAVLKAIQKTINRQLRKF